MTRRRHPAEHLASHKHRGVRAGWCACGAPILRGLDDDVCALTVVVDPTPLTATGEAIARIQGRQTFEIRVRNGLHHLASRNASAIQRKPPGTKAWVIGLIDVVAEHACHSFPLPSQPSVHSPKPNRKELDDDQPPY